MRNDYLRSKLEDENIHPEKKCVYGDINYSNSVNGIRYQLDNFCSIRDKLERINKIKSDRETTKNLVQHACGNEDPRLPLTVYVTPNVRSSQKIKCEETPSDNFLGDYSQYVNRNSGRVGIT
ncbi:PIR Superfamily Protein [Plasmodium ovale curtisi]|uniref:PIR Superfamily Protein n=1 Tax=Plasmodium ovale curtisi TaxID=864141 RepID=A0A1A8X6K4_PLAOA|nr:PIR Superfamily Protein [Plasmodium ovale curtisi]